MKSIVSLCLGINTPGNLLATCSNVVHMQTQQSTKVICVL